MITFLIIVGILAQTVVNFILLWRVVLLERHVADQDI